MKLVLTGFTTHSVVACVDLVLMVRCVKMSEDTALMVVSQIIRNLCVKIVFLDSLEKIARKYVECVNQGKLVIL